MTDTTLSVDKRAQRSTDSPPHGEGIAHDRATGSARVGGAVRARRLREHLGHTKRIAVDGDHQRRVAHAVSTINEAVNGSTTVDLLQAVQGDDALRAEIASADIVTVDIGGTDYDDSVSSYVLGDCGGNDGEDCLRAAVRQFRQAFGPILDAIVDLRGGAATLIRNVDLYQSHHNLALLATAGANAGAVVTGYLRDFNAVIEREARAHDGLDAKNFEAWNRTDGTHDPADDGLMATDGSHPTTVGQQAIADLLTALGFAPLG